MSEQYPVVAKEDCEEHDISWMMVGGEHSYCCKRCGYAYDANGNEVRSHLTVDTPVNGLPDSLYRAWAPIFPLELV